MALKDTSQNGDKSKTATTKSAIRQNGNTSKTGHSKTVHVAVLVCRRFGFVAVLIVSRTATNPKRRHFKTATIQLSLSPKRFQNAMLTCIQNGDTVKIQMDFIRRTIPLIYKIIIFKRNVFPNVINIISSNSAKLKV